MKKLAFILFIFTTWQCQAQSAGNDVKKYGLKGKVKVMEEARFPYTKEVNGEWSVVDTVGYTVDRYSFDESGKLITLENIHYQVAGKRGTNSTITKFSYKDGKISGSKTYSEQGALLSESTVTWLAADKYKDIYKTAETNDEVEHTIDKDMRNKQTIAKRFDKAGRLVASITTTFEYDKRGRATKSVITDAQSKNTYHFDFKPLGAEDENGNRSKVLFTEEKSAMPNQLLLYTYEYYN